MAIDTKQITKLRQATGAGIADVKNALGEADNDFDKAVEILRKSGTLKADKKAERATNEGVIAMNQQGNKIATVGLGSETDFVARNEEFIQSVDEFAAKLMEVGVDEFRTWADEKIKNELIVKIGENLQLISVEILEGEVIGKYLHSNKKIAAVVVLTGGSEELANDLAMQVTAMYPKYVKPKDVPAEELDKEKEIYRERLKSEGKPENIWDKIMEGKLKKYYQEVCLLKQTYIKDDSMTIEQLIDGKAEVVKFVRYQI